MDDVNDIAAFYNSASKVEEERLVRHQLEFDLTWRILERFVPPTASILEIGCGAGAYTVPLTRWGHRITTVDMSERLLEPRHARLQESGLDGKVRLVQADARNLQAGGADRYETVLLMGPLYHLVCLQDRQQALSQAVTHLMPGGVLLSAHISRFGIMGDLMKNVPA